MPHLHMSRSTQQNFFFLFSLGSTGLLLTVSLQLEEEESQQAQVYKIDATKKFRLPPFTFHELIFLSWCCFAAGPSKSFSVISFYSTSQNFTLHCLLLFLSIIDTGAKWSIIRLQFLALSLVNLSHF